MNEWEVVHRVAALSFGIGALFGAVAYKTNFCTMGAISDWVNIGSKDRLRAWFLAIGIAILATQGLQASGKIDMSQAIYLSPNLGWLGHLVGGLLFGIGMTLASGCGQRTLVRVGGGNLKSLVVFLLLGLTAYMTMRGLLALVRVNVFETTNIGLAASGMSDQGIGTMIAALTGIENVKAINWATTIVLGGGMVVFAFAARSFRHSFDNILAGIVIGLLIPAGWYVTGVVGFDDFDPVRFESFTFVAPSGESLMYLLTFTGSTIGFGVAAVGGVIAGAFIYSVASGNFRVETFTDKSDMLRHIAGGIAMGFGGVLALGCTIGQGVTGMSTLAIGSMLTLVSIIFGSALTMKIDYYRLDDMGFAAAFRQALTDMLLPHRSGAG
jgi:uncharacterized membrane protein YedE/YeeE